MFSLLVAHAAIGAVKALPRALGQLDAMLDVLLSAQKGEARAVVDVTIGVSAPELRALMGDAKFRGAVQRGELLKRTGAKPVTVD